MLRKKIFKNEMRRIVPKNILGVIRKIAGLAERRGCKAYLVGGFVRDILLGAKNLDVDIVIEGDALKIARYASLKTDAALVMHKKFGTATLIVRKPLKGARFKIDMATARKEFYKKPAALPSVESSSIREDLYRRDFTINAMAVSINRKDYGRLIDFFDGRKDLAGKRIRVLHKKSFIDDPTRIFRAVRFEQRYNFKIDSFTAALIKNAVKREMFNKVSGERLRQEIELLLKEKSPLKAIKRMKGLDELRFISPKIKFGAGKETLCRNINRIFAKYGRYLSKKGPLDLWLVYFMAMIDTLTLDETLKVCDRFMMKRGDKLRIASAKASKKRIASLLSSKKNVKPSKIYRALEPLSYEALLFIMAECGGKLVKERARGFLTKYNGVRVSIGGADLKRLGAEPGPCFADILKKTLYAKIDGLIFTKQDELVFAEKQVKRCINRSFKP